MGRAEGVYRHEKIGHQGVISVLKDKLDTFVNQLIDNATEAQLRGINKLSQRLNGKNVGELNADQKNTLGQEYIAVAAEKPGSYTTTWEKIKAFVRSVLRDMGIKLSVSDNDIKVLLDRAAKFKKQQLSSTNFSGKNNLSLQKLANYANDIVTGKTVFKRFSQAEQRGFTEGGTIHVEASIILAANEGADGQSNTSNEEQENSIESYAKQKGVWVENVNAKYGEHHKSGEEALVWANPQRKIVTKSQNTYQYGDLQRKLDSITLHNAKFPETALKVIGFGRNTEGDFQVIVEQPFIVANENGINDANNPIQVAKKKELIKQYMGNLGFENTEKNDYADNETLISDLHNGNVIITPQNNIAVIDPIMGLNTLNEGYGGTREIQGNDFSGITQSPLFSSKEMEDRLRIVREQRELQGQEPVILPKELKEYADLFIIYVKKDNPDATAADVIKELEKDQEPVIDKKNPEKNHEGFTEAEKSDLYKYVNQKMAGNIGVQEEQEGQQQEQQQQQGQQDENQEEQDGSKENEFSKSNVASKINALGKNKDSVTYESILSRKKVGKVGSVVETSETAENERLYLALQQNDSVALLKEFKEEFGSSYLKKALSFIKNANLNIVAKENLLSFGIALENEISDIRSGVVENEFKITVKELSKVNSNIQYINKKTARTGSMILNISKLLYNWYDTSRAYSRNLMTDSQTKETNDVEDILEQDDKLSEAADSYENNEQAAENNEQAAEQVEPVKKQRKRVKNVDSDSEIAKDLAQLKKDLEDLNC